jgi:predicted dehydrogenase
MTHDGKRPTLAVIGAGSRGSGYATWVTAHPDRARVVAVAEPREHYRQTLADEHNLPPERVFTSWQDLVAAGKLADAAIITTLDTDHLAPAAELAGLGYHLLVEKPLAPTAQEAVS